MLRSVILAASRNATVERVVGRGPGVAQRRAPLRRRRDGRRRRAHGTRADRRRAWRSAWTTSARTPPTPAQADATVKAYLVLLDRLSEPGLTAGGRTEVSVKLSRRRADARRRARAEQDARTICEAARAAGTTVTLDMEDHTTTDRTLATLRRAAPGLPGHRRGACRPTCTAPRTTAARSPTAGCAGAAVQGRLQGAAVGRLPDRGRGRRVVRPLPEGADGRRRLPDGRDPRPGAHRVARSSWRPARTGDVRVPDAVRHPPARAGAARRGGPHGARLRPVRRPVVRLPHATTGRATRQPGLLPARPGEPAR